MRHVGFLCAIVILLLSPASAAEDSCERGNTMDCQHSSPS